MNTDIAESIHAFVQTEEFSRWYAYIVQVSPQHLQTESALIKAYRLLAPLAILDHLQSDRQEINRQFAHFLLEQKRNQQIMVVDYGCGFAPISLEIARLSSNVQICLVDVDCMVLDFIAMCFRQENLAHQIIRVTKENLYPALPSHDICIAAEVFEHLLEPLRAFEHIIQALAQDGILYGCFRDKKPGGLHVNPNLADIRQLVDEYFDEVSNDLSTDLFYRRKRT